MDEPKPMTELTRIRQERNLSQQRLADASGVNKATINQIERGRRSPNVETLERLAKALGAEVADFFPKAQRRLSLEPSLFDGLEGERRESKLPRVADMLLNFGQMLLLTWEAELPARARADDDQWLQDIRLMWQQFGLINYGVTEEVSAGGLDDKGEWLSRYMARYMDLNATIHRINATIRDNLADGASPDEEAAVLLKPLATVA